MQSLDPKTSAYRLLFVAAGAFSFVAQAVLFREYLVLHQGNELAIGLFFGSWLAWVALGAVAARRLRAALPRLLGGTPTLTVAYALAPLSQLWAIRSFRALAGVPAWEPLPLGALLLMTALANAPVSLLTGALFTVASAAAGGGRGAAARNYVAECVGSFIGGALVTALVMRGAPGPALLLGAALVLLVPALLLARREGRRRQLALVVAAAALVAVTLALGSGPIERAAERSRFSGVLPRGRLVAWTDTPYRHLALGKLGAQTIVIANGELSQAFPDEPGLALEAALVMTQRPGARRVLVIGDAIGGLLRHLLCFGPQQLLWLDPDPAASAFVADHLLAKDRDALHDRRLRVRAGDPRAQLRLQPRGAFDLVAVLVPDPDTALLNRFFTREFYRELRARLAPGGVLVTRIQSEVNYLAREATSYGAAITHTLGTVFDRVLVSPGEQQWIFAGDRRSPLTLDGEELARRYAAVPLAHRHFRAQELEGFWPAERVEYVRERYAAARRSAGDRLLNTDARPVGLFYGLVYRTRALGSDVGRVLHAVRAGGAWLFVLPLLVFGLLRAHFVAGRPRPARVGRFNALLLVLVAGGAGMALQVLLMVAFQSRLGALFEEVGLVGGLFMAGLATGGWLFVVLARRAGRAPWRLIGLTLAAIGVLALVAPALSATLADLDQRAARGAFYALFFVAGLISGAAFPLADAVLALGGADAGEVAGRLEAVDHWGGAAAALATGTLLLPTLGVARSGQVLAVAVGVVLLLLAQQRWMVGRAPGWLGRWLELRARGLSFERPALSYLLVGVVIATGVATLLVRAALEQPQVRFSSAQLARLVDGRRFVEREKPFVHYRVDPGQAPAGGRSGRARAALAASMAVAPDVRGYAGPLNLLVDVGADGRLRRVALLESRETPAYIAGLGRWLAALEGKPLERPLQLRRVTSSAARSAAEVDTLTGATITAEAALEAVNRTGGALARAAHGLRSPAAGATGRRARWAGLVEPAALYLLLAMITAVLVTRVAGARLRLAFLAANVVMGGLIFNTQFSLVDVRRLMLLELPGPAQGAAFVLFVGVLILAVLFGPLYCGYLCPFGAAQELLGRLVRAGRLHHRIDDAARFVKYLLLALSVLLLSLGGAEWVMDFDPLRYRLGRQAAGWSLALIIIIALGSLLVTRPWCRYFCPVGAALNLLNKLRLLRRWQRPRIYSACDLGVDGPLDVDCLQCDRCVFGATVPYTEPAQPLPTVELSDPEQGSAP